MNIVFVHAGVGEPSTTRLLVDRISQVLTQEAARLETTPRVQIIELKTRTKELAQAAISGFVAGQLEADIQAVMNADAIVLASPIYKASYSGLFKLFIDVLDNDALLGKPVLLAATGGSSRHALAIDNQMRPLMGYLRALVMPTALYATAADWSDSSSEGFASRMTRAVRELLTMTQAQVSTQMLDANWDQYQHTLKATERADGREEFTYDPSLIDAIYGGSLQ